MTPCCFRKFTIHFATINTFSSSSILLSIFAFTIHFATINTMGWCMWSASRYNLQYTLLLLIPLLKQLEIIPHDYLQYTLLLLIHNEAVSTSLDDMNLQYTLLLLIPWIKAARRFLYFKFTIHFATINTIVAFNPASSFIPFTIHFATINTRYNTLCYY